MALSANSKLVLLSALADQAAYIEIKDCLNAISVLSGAEAAFLDGVTAGTAAASKALVLNSSGGIATITSATITTGTIPTLAGGVVFNEAGGDFDHRLETDTNANFIVIDAALNSIGAMSIGAAVPTNPQALLAILPPVNAAGVTASQSYFHTTLLPGAATTIPAGTAPVVASMNIHEPNITATGTVTVGATVRIVDAPTEGSTNYALWVDAGASRFDGDVVVGAGAVPTNPQAQFAILPQTREATLNQSYFHGQILATGGAITIPTGTAPIVASLNIHEPNITSTGTTTVACTVRIVDAPTEGGSNYALWVDAGVTRLDGNLDFGVAAASIISKPNTTAALSITDATTSLYVLDTRNTVTVQNHKFDLPAAQTLPDGATSRLQGFVMPAHTVTLAGATQVTTANDGAMMHIGAVTYNQAAGAVTVDAVSALYIGTPVAGSSVTITKNSFVQTGVSGCFCSAAGTWTDTSSRFVKKDIKTLDVLEMPGLLDKVEVVKFRKKEIWDGDHERFGVIAEDVLDCMASPDRDGVAAIYMAGFTLAGVKYLHEENKLLKARLAKLEAAAA